MIAVDDVTPRSDTAMARKQKETPPVIATEEEVKSVRLELPLSLHIEFRVLAAKRGMSMAAYAKHLIEECIAKGKEGRR
jgi:hypothetical protein